MLGDSRNQASAADAYAFLPVWRRISLQFTLLAAGAGFIVIIGEFFAPQLPAPVGRILALAQVCAPLLLWLLLSVLPEYRFARPRRRLIGVAVVCGLSAAAIGLPLVEGFFRSAEWLPLQSVFQRILGYSFTAGIVDVALKFVALRYLVYPQGLRARSDAIAYGMASAIGYSFYLNLALAWRLEPTWDIAAIYVLAQVAIQFASSMFIVLGIIESYFSDAFPLVLPVNILIAALTTGLITPLVSGLLSGPLGTGGNSDRPLFAIGLVLAVLTATLAVVYFLYSNSERRWREAFGRDREDSDAI